MSGAHADEQLGRERGSERDRIVDAARHLERLGAERARRSRREREVPLDGEPGEQLAPQHRARFVVVVVERLERALQIRDEVEIGDAELVPPSPEPAAADAEHRSRDAHRIAFGAGALHRASQREARVAQPAGRAQRPTETR